MTGWVSGAAPLVAFLRSARRCFSKTRSVSTIYGPLKIRYIDAMASLLVMARVMRVHLVLVDVDWGMKEIEIIVAQSSTRM